MLIFLYRSQKLELKPLILESFMRYSVEKADFDNIENFELPPPALVENRVHSERLLSIDNTSDSDTYEDFSDSLSSHSSPSDEESTNGSEDGDSSFRLPPSVIHNHDMQVLRPTFNNTFCKGGFSKASTHPESILNFLQSQVKDGRVRAEIQDARMQKRITGWF